MSDDEFKEQYRIWKGQLRSLRITMMEAEYEDKSTRLPANIGIWSPTSIKKLDKVEKVVKISEKEKVEKGLLEG